VAMSHLPTGRSPDPLRHIPKIALSVVQCRLHGQPRDDVYFCNYAGITVRNLVRPRRDKQGGHITVQELSVVQPEQLVHVTERRSNLIRHEEEARRRAALSRQGQSRTPPERRGQVAVPEW